MLALGACSAGGADETAQGGAGAADEAASATTVATARDAAPAAGVAPQQGTPPAAVGEALAITARATVRADDVQAAVDRISTTVTAHGGRITAADIHHATAADGDGDTETTDASRATLVLAVPPDQLAAVRAGLDDAGEVVAYEQEAEDVAKQLTDLASRITNQRASIARIRELYTSATDLEAIVRIEAELTDRETTLEQLLASQAALQGRVAMSTLTVDISPVPAAPAPADDDPGLVDALAGGWRAFAGALFAIVLVLTAAMPFVLTALAIALVVLWALRRTRRPLAAERPAQAEPAAQAAVREEVAAASRPE